MSDTVPASVVDRSRWRELYTYGHRKLGYGVGRPGSKGWNFEVAMLGKVLKKRNVTDREFLLAVDYCARIGKTVTRPSEVLYRLADAKQEELDRRAVLALEVDERIAEAVASERCHPRDETPDWVDRLMRARGEDGKLAALAEWEASRG